jgi:hypothetical protein
MIHTVGLCDGSDEREYVFRKTKIFGRFTEHVGEGKTRNTCTG